MRTVVSYPDDTPDHIVNQAMDAIKSAGGMVSVLIVSTLLPCQSYCNTYG
jgi:hypothetical protein